MSIAVSASIKPSRWLKWTVSAMCAAAAVSAWLAVSITMEDGLFEKWVLVPILAGATFFCQRHWAKKQTVKHLLVSASSNIYLQSQENGQVTEKEGQAGAAWRLLPTSTLWPYVMILHLEHPSAQKETLVILRDCVPHSTFQALLVACRWLVLRPPEKIG